MTLEASMFTFKDVEVVGSFLQSSKTFGVYFFCNAQKNSLIGQVKICQQKIEDVK